ncbi:MAG TPA: glycosyltransferase [Pyrinomonadaceae bacterium]|jgi:glycosyltransferase involved in cell wall biosynthesis|nr:glycosyltransferase [Pyrinomonadaceae bacterium]
MISGRDIVYVSSIEWNFLWQGHQEIARRLAGAGNRVFYLENTGVRAPGVRDARRVAFRLRRWAGALRSGGVREVAPNVYVCSPLVLPPFGSALRRGLNRHVLLRLVRRTARRLGIRDPLIWTYLPTDTTLDLVRTLPHRELVYYCVADFTQLTPQPEKLRAAERELLRRCDVVFAFCTELATTCAEDNPNVHVFPAGVNLDAFPPDAATRATAGAVAVGDATDAGAQTFPPAETELANLPRPIIGYVGGMHRHVDFELLKSAARARPDWSWVCVGALQADTRGLADLPNVHMLGQKPHEELVNYIRRFDVCIVPYVNSVYTRTVVPTKINEYLATGKPVVSTDIPTVCEFNEEHRVLLTSPADAERFVPAVAQALAMPHDLAAVRKRRRVAEQGDWGKRLEEMSGLIEASVEGRNPSAAKRRARAAS